MKQQKNTTNLIPLSVPTSKKALFKKNYEAATHKTGRLFLFAGDQKIEHLNADFYGKGIPAECNDPEHLFKIADTSPIGVFATQLGLVARYGNNYLNINYLVKLNSKTNCVPTKQAEPLSLQLNSVSDVVTFNKTAKLNIVGVGYTLYLGSEHEHKMLTQAASMIFEAHQQGLLTILWIYPRGKAVKNELSENIIAGAAGVGAALGADFVKINPPQTTKLTPYPLQQVTRAAGRTKVICSGGSKISQKDFLQQLHEQINKGGTAGCAVGRNIHQRTLSEAVNFSKAIAAIVYKKASLADAYTFIKKGK